MYLLLIDQSYNLCSIINCFVTEFIGFENNYVVMNVFSIINMSVGTFVMHFYAFYLKLYAKF